MTTQLLDVRGVHLGYGMAEVIRGLDLEVGAGEVVALIGPNGAGKTTTLLGIAGRLRPSAGEIWFGGSRIDGLATHRVVRHGVGMLGEDRGLIASLSVSETFALLKRRSLDPVALFPELKKLLRRRCGLLSGGEQQMLGLARALAPMPKLLLVDELSQGLAPLVVKRLLDVVRSVADEHGIGLLIVEQHVRSVLEIADRGYVLVKGQVVRQGTGSDLLADLEDVEASYLGTAV